MAEGAAQTSPGQSSMMLSARGDPTERLGVSQPDASRVDMVWAVGFPVVGVVGGGQLARMMQVAAIPLGVRLKLLADRPDDSAAQVIPAVTVGDYRDLDALVAFATGCDVVTFDHEHVPTDHVRALASRGIAVHPSADALVYAQDKIEMRRRLSAAGLPSPAWRSVHTADDVVALGDDVGWPVVIKAPRGGYDGKGVWVVRSAEEAAGVADNYATGEAPLLAEEHVDFERELAVLVARSPYGQAAAYAVVQTVQADGVCRDVIAPAPGLRSAPAELAQEVGLKIAGELDVTGVLAVEMFQIADSVVVNELAMRPHNSGHWTIDGAVTGQFEQHLRAILNLPLGSPAARAPYTVMANVLGRLDDRGRPVDPYPRFVHCQARDPGLRIHMYGKEVRAGRKIGHVTVCGDDLDELRERSTHAAAYLSGAIDG
jgi:5-(carboxyamino)imidazole ribonucleotide synthase